MKINDWSSIQSLFDELNKRLDKTQKMNDVPGVPRSYVRMLVELEDFLTDTLGNKDVKKKMSATNAKALNTMRQRLKKHNVGFAEPIAKFRENPESTDEEEEEEEEMEEEEERAEGEGEGDDFKKTGVGRAWSEGGKREGSMAETHGGPWGGGKLTGPCGSLSHDGAIQMHSNRHAGGERMGHGCGWHAWGRMESVAAFSCTATSPLSPHD